LITITTSISTNALKKINTKQKGWYKMICLIVKKPFEENYCKKYRLDAGVMNNEKIFITACKKIAS
jgi:hypothetical protein